MSKLPKGFIPKDSVSTKQAAKVPKGFIPKDSAEPSAMDYVQDVAVPAIQGATLNMGDEAVGAVGAILETGGGSKQDFGEIMDRYSAPMREAYAESKKRSPVISTVSEIGGAIVTPLNKVLPGFGGVPRAVAEGVTSSIASRDKDKFSKDSAQDAIVSGAASGGMEVISRGIRSMINKNPNTVRARVSGAGSKEFGEGGVKDREDIAKDLNALGFFSGRKVKYDPSKMKYTPAASSKFTLDQLDLPVPERLMSRAEEGIEAISKEKENIWPAVKNKVIPEGNLDNILSEAVGEYTSKNPRYFKALEQAGGLKDELIQTLKARALEKGQDGITLRDIDDLKSDLYAYTQFGKDADALPDSDVLYQKLARKMKEFVNDNIGDARFKELNEMQGKLLTVKGDLSKKINIQKGMGSRTPEIDPVAQAKKIGFDALGGEDAQLTGAGIREKLDTIPFWMRSMGQEGMERAPGVLLRNQQNEGQEIPQGVARPPQAYIPRQMKSIPEQLVETPLERNSDALVANKRLVMAKFAQQAPEFFGMVAEAAKDDEQFKKVMGFLANSPKIPGQPSPRDLFRTDKYDTFDGKIMDPQMKMLAMDDCRNNDSLDSIQKAALMNKIQKGEPIA